MDEAELAAALANVVKSIHEANQDEDGEGSAPMEEAKEALEELASGQKLRCRTFEELMMLTDNAGFVIEIPGGAEYQVTIVRSR